ncbi:exodeoxyribonuclease VII small subunit [bacterium]|nr:exodeoxyribonuclease VII small subunit [bacterium]
MSNQNFEDIMAELKEIVSKMESEKLSLDESVEIFEKGMLLSKKAQEILDNAQKRVSVYTQSDSNM